MEISTIAVDDPYWLPSTEAHLGLILAGNKIKGTNRYITNFW